MWRKGPVSSSRTGSAPISRVYHGTLTAGSEMVMATWVRPGNVDTSVAPLRTGFVDDVERGFGDPADPGESGIGGQPAYRLLAGLRTERVAAALRQRVRDAQE